MAKVSNWYVDSTGNYVVKYADGSTRVMTQLQAIQENVIKDPGTLGVNTSGGVQSGTVKGLEEKKSGTSTTPTTPAGPGSYGADMGGAFAQDPLTGQYYNTSNTVPIVGADGKQAMVPISVLIQKANDPKELGKVRNALVQYGIIGKGTKSKQAITNAYVSVLASSAATSMNPNDWMKQFAAAGGGVDVKTTAPTPDQVNIRKYEKSTIQPIAEQIYIKLAGRVPTAKEITDLTKGLNLKEKDVPTTTSYKRKDGKVIATTTGGVDEQQYITEQAKKAKGYKETQTLNFENWLLGAVTGQGA